MMHSQQWKFEQFVDVDEGGSQIQLLSVFVCALLHRTNTSTLLLLKPDQPTSRHMGSI